VRAAGRAAAAPPPRCADRRAREEEDPSTELARELPVIDKRANSAAQHNVRTAQALPRLSVLMKRMKCNKCTDNKNNNHVDVEAMNALKYLYMITYE